jgi:hypothetical protein
MAVEYPGHWLRTRQQAAWQALGLSLVLLPLAVWRATMQPPAVGLGLVLLTMTPFALAYQTWRFLGAQERLHEEPTSGMKFAFRFLASTPLTFGALLLVVLTGLR